MARQTVRILRPFWFLTGGRMKVRKLWILLVAVCLILCFLLTSYISTQNTKTDSNIGDFLRNIVKKQNKAKEIKDVSLKSTTFEAHELPLLANGEIDTRYMASVGNGHVATVIYSNTTYVNGLYSGQEGFSHRARVPSKNAIRVHFDPFVEKDISRHFILNTEQGVWREIINHKHFVVIVNIYAHQYYNRLLVTQIEFMRIGRKTDEIIEMRLENNEGGPSRDIKFADPELYNHQYGKAWKLSGQIAQTELSGKESGIPNQKTAVYVFYSDLPSKLEVNTDSTHSHMWTFITSIDQDEQVAKKDFDDATAVLITGADQKGRVSGPRALFDSHMQMWEKRWHDGGIEVDDLALGKYIYGSMYYILSSLPSLYPTNQPKNQFFGLSPGSLANGANASDYMGHNFWDTETWMYPPILMFYPEHAKDILSYRWHGREAARKRAKANGHFGTRYPWESAYTGAEVTPGRICMACRENQIHITSDIAFAARQYFSATRDMKWLNEWGREFIYDMADFWQSRVTPRKGTDAWEIKGVMCPDEYARNVSNSFYTNIGASQTISYAKYLQCVAGAAPPPDDWMKKATGLVEVIDTSQNYHPEHEHYIRGTTVKQADVILAGFPLMWNVGQDVRKNDLDVYEQVTDPLGPAMTWGMFAIGHIELRQYNKAADLFKRSYSRYVREPYKIWTEVVKGMGAVNFITGMGGFLQAIIFGYGGIRLRVDELTFDPVLPPNVNTLNFKNLKYLGSVFDFFFDQYKISIKVERVDPNHAIKLQTEDGNKYAFVQGQLIEFDRTSGRIFSESKLTCDPPVDRMDQRVAVRSLPTNRAARKNT
ncbi:protein-glucosylgalactosylhydroxylysine glucosidase-like [Ptychodera flava]|uniref:protein-glucosylgalactosylhydroxylysine glucosidase-like n=1 Tax=Ptychodera flava TaxID=63121 RepID=UPI00396A8BE0